MRLVIDTNVLAVCFSHKSPYRKIFDSFLNGELTLCVTTDILTEYEEIIGKHLNPAIATSVLQLIENAPNVVWVTKYYKWNLIKADPDDNKFADCAIASNAKYLVSNDRHFNVIKELPFPKVDVINAAEFLEVLK